MWRFFNLGLALSMLQSVPGLQKYSVTRVESLHYPALARAAGLQGEVMLTADVDSDGKVVHIEATSTRAILKEAAAENIGKWTFEPRASGIFQFTVFYEFVLREKASVSPDENVSFDFDLPHTVRVVASPPPVDADAASRVHVIRHAPMHYPALARQTRIQGVVKLFVVIDQFGKVVELDVESGHPLLKDAATQNLRSWQFEPPALGPTAFEVTYEFVSEGKAEYPPKEDTRYDLPKHIWIAVSPPEAFPDKSR